MTERFIPSDADIVSRCRATTKPGQYMILPQANRVDSMLPSFEKTSAQVLATPSLGARFIQHELQMQPGGKTATPFKDNFEHFLFVLEGSIRIDVGADRHDFSTGGYAYLPHGLSYSVENVGNQISRILWTRKRFLPSGSLQPSPIFSNEKDVTAEPVDTYMEQHLVPHEEDMAYDLAFNILNFEPGIYFGFVESHIMEHGLYMLEGSGIYWLNGNYHDVQKNDYIYMAPYCPQFYYATGWVKGRYLLYKEVNRDYIENL